MTGGAHGGVLTPATRAHSAQEPTGLADAVRCLDAHRPGYQHRPVRYHLHPHALGHGFFAPLTPYFFFPHPPLFLAVGVSPPRPVRYHLPPHALGHGLSARITTSFSVRHPRLILPVAVSHPARADSTGPNGIDLEAITSAFNPVARNEFNDSSTPHSSD